MAGAKPTTIIVAGMSVAIFGAIINLYTGFQEVDKEKLEADLHVRGTKVTPSPKGRPSLFDSTHPECNEG